ncbi:hypothetical protein TNCV_4049741 [Trichonephila clavipes]|nr:hypothetical protein TNCV_4049741 [Trichonephila clavipes]
MVDFTPRLLIDLNKFHTEIGEVEIEVVSPSIVPSVNFAELNRTATCMVLKDNDRRTSSPLPRWISWSSIRLRQTETILPAAKSSDFARHLVLVLPHHTFNHVQTSSTLATDD